jgi:hypothetical protein
MRAWTAALAALALQACSGGTYPPGYYSTGQPFGDVGDEGGSEDEDTGIDLDGDGPPPPPGDDGGLPPPPGGTGDCCVGHDSRGCDNKPVEQCVCASDSWCCESEWDDACAALIEQLGCGHCTAGDGGDPPPADDGGGDPPPPPADDGGGDPPPPDDGGDPPPADDGGGDPPPADDGGGDPPPPDDGGMDPPVEGGDCCMAGEAPGCADATIEACVCMQDSYCCDTAWDGLCVDEVGSFGCGSCGPEGGDGGDGGEGVSACCEQQDGAGCPDTTVQDCVCAVDDYCCNVFWDLTCVGEVETLSCGSCG